MPILITCTEQDAWEAFNKAMAIVERQRAREESRRQAGLAFYGVSDNAVQQVNRVCV